MRPLDPNEIIRNTPKGREGSGRKLTREEKLSIVSPEVLIASAGVWKILDFASKLC